MTQEQGRRPDQSQQNTPLRPALEAFGAGNTPFSTGEQPKTDFETLQTTTEPNVPVSGRNRMNSQLGIGTDDRGEIEHVAVRGPIPGGRTDIPSSGRTAEGGKEPKKFTRRRVLGWLTAGLGTAAVGGGIGGFSAANKNGETNPTPTLEATKPAGGDATPKPETPIPTATPSPTEITTPAAEPEGARGNVAKVEDLNIPGNQKETVMEMLKDSTVQIIVEKNGQTIIFAAKNKLLTSEGNTQRICPATIGAKSTVPCRMLGSLSLNTENFSEEIVIDKLIGGVMEGKRQAYISKTGAGVSLDEYSKGNSYYLFPMRATDVFTRETSIVNFGKDSPLVYILEDQPDDVNVELSGDFGLRVLSGNGVLGIKSYSILGGVGKKVNSQGIELFSPAFHTQFTTDLGFLSYKNDLNVNNGGEGYDNLQSVASFAPAITAIQEHFYKYDANGNVVLSEHPTIFKVTGTIPS